MSNNYEDWPLIDIDEPVDTDVLRGRGRGTNFFAGNQKYRRFVEPYKAEYRKSSRIEKPMVTLRIVKAWRAQSPPGRYLQYNETTGKWFDIGDDKAREKTSQLLREKKPKLIERDESQNEDGSLSTQSDHSDTKQEPELEKKQAPVLEKATLAKGHTLGSQDLNPEEANLEDFEWQNVAAAPQVESSLRSIDFMSGMFDDGPGDGPAILQNILKNDEATTQFMLSQADLEPIPIPPMPPRGSLSSDEGSVKREKSSQGIHDMAPKTKKRAAFSRTRSATSNRLKQMMIEQVLTNQMCMEEFIRIGMKKLGIDAKDTEREAMEEEDGRKPQPRPPAMEEDDRKPPPRPQPQMPERTKSEEFEFNLLSGDPI